MRAMLPVLLLFATALPAVAADPLTLVACAPGYPGTSEQAQPTMDEFAKILGDSAGWAPDRLRAVYHERLDAGLERLSSGDAALAMVPLAFYLEYRDALDLTPLLEVEQAAGPKEIWTLVARKGAVEGPSSLEGWRVVGMPGYSPRFVRRVALGELGTLPAGIEIEFSARILSALRTANRGEPVAVLLDTAQSAALPSLPYASELESVGRSGPMVASLVCRVGSRLSADEERMLIRALVDLEATESGREALETLRVARFLPLDGAALERFETAFDGPRADAP